MATTSEQQLPEQSGAECSSPAEHANNSAGRIREPGNGKTCHQCRQKIKCLAVSCKNQKKEKLCPIKFCERCLFNRYGEKAEEAALLEDWKCPKCRGICNCSICRKKGGYQPTGILVHKAMANGFSSVSEMLHVEGPENFGIDRTAEVMKDGPIEDASPSNGSAYEGLTNVSECSQIDEDMFLENSRKKPRISDGVSKEASQTVGVLEEDEKMETIFLVGARQATIRHEKSEEQREDGHHKGLEVLDGQKVDKDGTQPCIVTKARKNKKNARKSPTKDIDADHPLPQGTELTTIAGIDLPAEEIGHALQFLEFCATFKEILDLKEGESVYILRELVRGGRACQGKYSPVVQFHIHLLSLIQKDLGEGSPVISSKPGKNYWLEALQNCATRSQCAMTTMKLKRFGRAAAEYDNFDLSERLILLNFLCDEFISTAKIRSWIDDENSKFIQKVKEAKEKAHAAKQKKKQLKQKMHDEVAKAIIAKNGVPLSTSEHQEIVSQIKSEVAEAHAEMLESEGMVPKEKQSDAVRIEPLLSGINGHRYWRLKGCSDESNVLLQDVGSQDAIGLAEKWSTFEAEQEREIEKCICSFRKRSKLQKSNDELSSESGQLRPDSTNPPSVST